MRWHMYIGNQLFFDSTAASRKDFIFDPHLKLEINKAGTFEFDILPTHSMYGSFTRMKTYVRVWLDDDELFRGRVLSIEDNLDMQRHISCEGDLAFLVDSLQFPDQIAEKDQQSSSSNDSQETTQTSESQETTTTSSSDEPDPMSVNLAKEKATHESLYDHFVRYISVHNSQMEVEKEFLIGNVTIDDRLVEQDFTSTNYRDTMSALSSDLLKVYGGYLYTRRTDGAVYIDWLKEPGVDATQQIKMGVNLLDLQKKSDSTDIFTVLVPVGDDQLTIADANQGSITIENSVGIAAYGRIYKTVSFNGVTDPAELKRLGQAYMDTNYKGDPVTISIKAIDMNLLDGTIERIKVGSGVTVVSLPHNISIKLVCTSIDYDILNPENNAYEIGDPKETLSQKQTADKVSTSQSVGNAKQTSTVVYQNTLELEAAMNRQAEELRAAVDELRELITTDPDTGSTVIRGSSLYIQGPATIGGILTAGSVQATEGDVTAGRLVSESSVSSETGFFYQGDDVTHPSWTNISGKPGMQRLAVRTGDGHGSVTINFYGSIG